MRLLSTVAENFPQFYVNTMKLLVYGAFDAQRQCRRLEHFQFVLRLHFFFSVLPNHLLHYEY